MRCSDCSKKVVPIVAVDIDGTLGMYHEHFTDFAMEYTGQFLHPEYDGSMEFHDWLGLPLHEYREIKLAYRQGGGKRSMPAFDDASFFFKHLDFMECEVWLTTTRPYLRLDSTDPDTRFWLERHGIKYDALMYHEDKYQKLAEHVERDRVVIILDDLESQLLAAAEVFGLSVPVMIERQSNSGTRSSLLRTTPDLIAATLLVQERIAEWKDTHG
jgi:uncharacterized HAD superfamily protein